MKPLNLNTNQAIADKMINRLVVGGGSSDLHSLEYKGKVIEDLYLVDVDFIDYCGRSKRGGNNLFEVEVYSKNKKGVVRKHKFPMKKKSMRRFENPAKLVAFVFKGKIMAAPKQVIIVKRRTMAEVIKIGKEINEGLKNLFEIKG